MRDVDVTVLLAVYNGADHVLRCLKSLNELFYKRNIEILIIDDGSTDGSLEIVKDFFKSLNYSCFLNIVSQRNVGLSQSLNNGITLSRGKFILRIDADDEYVAGRCCFQSELLNRSSSCLVCFGRSDEYLTTPYGSRFLKSYGFKSPDNLQFFNVLRHSSVMFRKREVAEIGMYNPHLSTSQDYDLWLRIWKKFGNSAFVYCDHACVVRYVEPQSISVKKYPKQIMNSFKIRRENKINLFVNLFSTMLHIFGSFKSKLISG